jgi:ABC-type lipoprotein export system ATPase subunit
MEGDQFSDFTAWIPQSAPVLPNRSVEDNVALGAFARGMSPARAYAIAQISLGEIGMRHYSFRRVRTLSGGERQRVAVARALAMGSPLILADEPTSSLDALNRDLVVSALRAVGARNGIVLIATHDEAVAAQCDHVIQLEDGKVQRAWSRNDVQ